VESTRVFACGFEQRPGERNAYGEHHPGVALSESGDMISPFICRTSDRKGRFYGMGVLKDDLLGGIADSIGR